MVCRFEFNVELYNPLSKVSQKLQHKMFNFALDPIFRPVLIVRLIERIVTFRIVSLLMDTNEESFPSIGKNFLGFWKAFLVTFFAGKCQALRLPYVKVTQW